MRKHKENPFGKIWKIEIGIGQVDMENLLKNPDGIVTYLCDRKLSVRLKSILLYLLSGHIFIRIRKKS